MTQTQTSREADMRALLDRALQEPGVADAIKAYQNLQRYQVTAVIQPPKVQFDTTTNR
jgi:hypothetical protein